MKKYILIPLLILSNFVLGQDSITYKYNVDLTGSMNNANNNQQNNIVFSTFNSVNWKKFETGMSTNYQLMTTNKNILINDFTLRVQPRIIDKNYSVFTFGQLSQLTSKKLINVLKLVLVVVLQPSEQSIWKTHYLMVFYFMITNMLTQQL
jgi:hypothetical protein